MNEDPKKKVFIVSNPTRQSNFFYEKFKSQVVTPRVGLKFPTLTPEFIGVDWAEGSGNTRGDVISKHDNVVEVQFRTVDFS